MPTRTDIRAAVETLTEGLAGITTVYRGRKRSIPSDALPAACIYIEREEKELDTIGTPRTFQRALTIVTEIHVQANSAEAAENLLDTYTAAREDAVLADETLGGSVESIFPQSDDYELSEEGQRPGGVATCTDLVIYVE